MTGDKIVFWLIHLAAMPLALGGVLVFLALAALLGSQAVIQ